MFDTGYEYSRQEEVIWRLLGHTLAASVGVAFISFFVSLVLSKAMNPHIAESLLVGPFPAIPITLGMLAGYAARQLGREALWTWAIPCSLLLLCVILEYLDKTSRPRMPFDLFSPLSRMFTITPICAAVAYSAGAFLNQKIAGAKSRHHN